MILTLKHYRSQLKSTHELAESNLKVRRFSRLGINFLGGGSEIKFLWHYIHLGLCPSLYPILHNHPVPSFRHSKNVWKYGKNMAWCVFTISRQGWDLGNCTQRFHNAQGWHPKRNPLPSRKTKGYLSPQWTLISKSVSFEHVPGADADLRDKQAVQATDVRLGNWTDNSNSISHPCASLIHAPGQLGSPIAWELVLELCLPFHFWCVTIYPLLFQNILEHRRLIILHSEMSVWDNGVLKPRTSQHHCEE